jgi:hypothetical protein
MDRKEAYVAAGRAVKWEIRQRLKAELPRMNAGAPTVALFRAAVLNELGSSGRPLRAGNCATNKEATLAGGLSCNKQRLA